jgi:glycosyltransferase involved in cell wall biosynthesis
VTDAGPLATVLLCTYNDEATVAAALDSALLQTALPSSYEIVVVDDGSTDGTAAILDSYEDRGVTVLRSPRNQGLPSACNLGLETIDTPFYLRLDGDDRFEPELIEALLADATARAANFVYSDRCEEQVGGSRRLRKLSRALDVSELIAAGVLLSTPLVKELGGYRDLFWEEYDLYIRLLESDACTVSHVPRPLYTYVISSGQMTSDERALEAGWHELRELWPVEMLAQYGLTEELVGVPGRS